MRQLREQALGVSASELGVAPAAARPHVWGALMETGYPGAVATLVVLADGTTSLYVSSGGGVIGAGQHASVREAAEGFLDRVEAHLEGFAPVVSTPLPSTGWVRFYVRTFSGTLGAEAPKEELGEGRHQLSPVFHAGHAVITAAREATERHQAEWLARRAVPRRSRSVTARGGWTVAPRNREVG